MTKPVRLSVCINQSFGTGKHSCIGSSSLDIIAGQETMLAHEGLDVAITRCEYQGSCAEGPVMRIAPGGAFFTEINQPDLVRIIAVLKTFIDAYIENAS
jgi:(2Fe-2S) ferredoxin